jgi:tRNA pseudouridine55 synthase
MTATPGVLLLDKPVGPTSREVLNEVERRLEAGPIGHAGTLDPLASGLLVALVGRARRLQDFFLGSEKTYVARIRFGETSRTLDAEGPITFTGVAPSPVPLDAVRSLLAGFVGEYHQAPPEFSAIRVRGRRAHELARLGRPVELSRRQVRVEEIRLLAVEEPEWLVEVRCGAGVYVRSLARDLGEARGCGAHLAELRRTRSGGLRIEDAVPPALASRSHLRPLAEVLAAEPRIVVGEEEARKLRLGDVIPRPGGPLAGVPAFAWFRGRPCFRLTVAREGLLRSDLLIEEPAWEGASPGGAQQREDEGREA